MTTFHDLAARQDGYIERGELIRIGMTDHEIDRLVERLHWQRPHPGVYRTGSAPPTWEGSVRAACMAAGRDARAMGRTAARLRGLDGMTRTTLLELSVCMGRGPEPHGVLIHYTRRSQPELTSFVRGIPVSTVNQTLLECAWLVRSSVVVEGAMEDALRRGLTGEGGLRRFLAGCGRGVNGVTALRGLLDGRPAGRPARNGFEVIVVDILRTFGVPLPLRRPLVTVPPDDTFELDLAYPAHRIDVEAMGKQWHSTPRQVRSDARRRRILESVGWQIIEVWWDDAIHDPARVAATVQAALDERARAGF